MTFRRLHILQLTLHKYINKPDKQKQIVKYCGLSNQVIKPTNKPKKKK